MVRILLLSMKPYSSRNPVLEQPYHGIKTDTGPDFDMVFKFHGSSLW